MDENLVTFNEEISTDENVSDFAAVEGRHVQLERIIKKKSMTDCDIFSVTVYLDKAEICRTVPINLEAGQDLELLLTQLSAKIDKDSIRIEAKGAAILIQDVTFRISAMDYNSVMADSEKTGIEKIEKETTRAKESFMAKQQRLNKQRAVLEKFADVLIKSQDCEKSVESNENDLDATKKATKFSFTDAFDPKHMETLNGFFDMYEKQAEKLDEQILNTKEELLKVDQILDQCEKRRNELEEAKEKLKTRELSIFIEAKEAVKMDLNIYYVVNSCSWKPCYDIRIMNNESKMKITYYALISQSTLEDWSDIQQLLISTVQPPMGGSVPEIGIQKVSFKSAIEKGLQSPQLRSKIRRSRVKSTVTTLSQVGSNSNMENSFSAPASPLEETLTKEPISNSNACNRSQKTSYKADIPCAQYNVPRCPELIQSGGEALRVIVGYIDLTPTFEYASVPRRAPYAFLKSSSINISEYVILPGEANVFIDSNYIGKTELKTVAPSEDFTCNLGADHRIQIKYHPMYKYKEGSAPLTKTMCLTYKQVIEVSNNHGRPIKMSLMDQLPFANEDKIKIILQEPAIKHPEKYDKSKPIRLTKNNQVEWDLEIGSGEKREVILKYSVEYPAGECLDLINE